MLLRRARLQVLQPPICLILGNKGCDLNNFAVVTDSTSNLPPGLAERSGIPCIPCIIHWGEESYLDAVTLDAETFYHRLATQKELPKTSQPSAGAFIAFFERVADTQGVDDILGVLLSSELSGTMASAVQARAQLAALRPGLRIELVDSRSVSMGLGLQVLAAQRVADAGGSVDAAIAAARQCYERTQILFAVDTLEYLHRGGRIGGASRLLGSVLNLKPVLTIDGGRVELLEKVRSRGKSLRRIIEIAEERLAGRRPKELALIHTGADGDLPGFAEMVAERLKPEMTYTNVLTPVIGVHSGPGTIGIGFCTE